MLLFFAFFTSVNLTRMFMRLRSVYFSQRYPLGGIGDMSVISAAQIHNTMKIRLACSPVFADWLKRRKAHICKE